MGKSASIRENLGVHGYLTSKPGRRFLQPGTEVQTDQVHSPFNPRRVSVRCRPQEKPSLRVVSCGPPSSFARSDPPMYHNASPYSTAAEKRQGGGSMEDLRSRASALSVNQSETETEQAYVLPCGP